MEVNAEISVAIGRLKKILRDNLFQRKMESTSGALNFNALHKYRTSQKVFTRKVERGGKLYNVELLLDNSGSMYHAPLAPEAFEAAHYLCKVLGPLTSMNVTLFNYTSHTMSWKQFHKDMVDTKHKDNTYYWKQGEVRKKEGQFVTRAVSGGKYSNTFSAAAGNWEIVDILQARDRLMKKEGEKIIIMLVDGRPHLDEHNPEGSERVWVNGYCLNKYPRSSYKETVEKVIAQGVKVIVFGIGGYNPRDMYPVGVSIEKPSHVINHIVAILEESLKK